MNYFRTLAVLVVVSSIGRADDTHVIKLKLDLDVDRSATYRTSSADTGSVKGIGPDGKQAFEIKKEGDETAYRVTVLARDKDGKSTKFIRVYDKANEKEDGKTKPFSYQGRTLLFDKVDGKFRVGVVGEPPLDSKDVAKLLKAVNQKGDSEAMLRNLPPRKPVKIGESWSMPVKPIAESMDDMQADLTKSSATAKLVKVYDKGKSKFGSIEVVLKFSITSMTEGGATMTFESPAVMEANLTVDVAIDASTTERKEAGTMSFKGEGAMTLADTKYRMIFDIKGKGGDEFSAEFYDAKAREVPKVAFAPEPGEWTEFKPKDASFQAKFPGRPTETIKKGEGFTETNWMTQTEGGFLTYTIAITEFDDPSKIDAKNVLKAAVNSLKGVKSQKEIEQNGFAGVEVVYEQEAQGFKFDVARRIIMANGRAFEASVVAFKGKTGESDKFFKSFQILEKPKKKDD